MPALEDLIQKAIGLISEAGRLLEEYDECSGELYRMGYVQAPVLLDEHLGFDFSQSHQRSWTFQGLIDALNALPEQGPRITSEERRDFYARGRCQQARISVKDKLGKSADWRCAYCHGEGTDTKGPDGRGWHVDHVYPRVHGGDNLLDNLALACATCNLKKNALTAAEFRAGVAR